MNDKTVLLNPIGVIRSCYKEKFGIPRQAGIVREARARIELYPPYDREEALRGLEDFSHIWVIFIFHKVKKDAWRPTVRPPRLGGNMRLGVFATRSPFRPAPVGLSAVKLVSFGRRGGRLVLNVAGGDFLDNTPVIDIKPYLPYADSLDEAEGGFAANPPESSVEIVFSAKAASYCRMREEKDLPGLESLIREILLNDPRPAYRSGKEGTQRFGIRMFDFDMKWETSGDTVCVVDFVPVGK